MVNILSADIGGTNSRFARFRADGPGGLDLVETVWLRTLGAGSFGQLIDQLRESGFSLKPEDADIASFAVAGPVERGVYSSPPLIPWDIDFSDAKGAFGLRRSLLINDFVAQAYACLSPVGRSALKVLDGRVEEGAAIAVIGAGTGLGKAALVPDSRGGLVPFASEGGHACFPFVSERECKYQQFLISKLGDPYPTGNVVVSGRGLSLVHKFLTGSLFSPEEVSGELGPGSETLEWMARFYGRACRDFALETLALGGLYIAGGVAARTPALVRHNAFREEFRSSASHARLLSGIPVFLMDDEQSGLWGAAMMALMELERGDGH